MTEALSIISVITSWTMAISSIALLVQYRRQRKINAWARTTLKIVQIEKALTTDKLNDLLVAADIDPSDPMFRDMPIQEAYEVIQVRLADRVKQIQEQGKRK